MNLKHLNQTNAELTINSAPEIRQLAREIKKAPNLRHLELHFGASWCVTDAETAAMKALVEALNDSTKVEKIGFDKQIGVDVDSMGCIQSAFEEMHRPILLDFPKHDMTADVQARLNRLLQTNPFIGVSSELSYMSRTHMGAKAKSLSHQITAATPRNARLLESCKELHQALTELQADTGVSKGLPSLEKLNVFGMDFIAVRQGQDNDKTHTQNNIRANAHKDAILKALKQYQKLLSALDKVESDAVSISIAQQKETAEIYLNILKHQYANKLAVSNHREDNAVAEDEVENPYENFPVPNLRASCEQSIHELEYLLAVNELYQKGNALIAGGEKEAGFKARQEAKAIWNESVIYLKKDQAARATYQNTLQTNVGRFLSNSHEVLDKNRSKIKRLLQRICNTINWHPGFLRTKSCERLDAVQSKFESIVPKARV